MVYELNSFEQEVISKTNEIVIKTNVGNDVMIVYISDINVGCVINSFIK